MDSLQDSLQLQEWLQTYFTMKKVKELLKRTIAFTYFNPLTRP